MVTTMGDRADGSDNENQHLNQHLEDQQSLLEESLPLVFSAFDEAKADGVENPVVILLDCDDPIGSQIARSWLGDEAVADAQATQEAEQATVFAHGFAWKRCRQEIPQVFPYLAPIFDQQPPRDGFLAISVTSGGASVLTVPWDARSG